MLWALGRCCFVSTRIRRFAANDKLSRARAPTVSAGLQEADMQIDITWDASTSRAPAAFTAAINYVVQFFDQEFTNNITVNIDVGWGEIDGQRLESDALGESESYGDYFSYSQV